MYMSAKWDYHEWHMVAMWMYPEDRYILGWRKGQAYFNYLSGYRPDIADQVKGTPVDPYFLDELVPVFLNVVEALWDD
jgi:hypothetical protein